jgi:pimeloyl-ACP methyl ester carboxylesterase
MYGERTRRRHAARIGEDIARRLATTSSLATHVQQLGAAGAHSTAGRLREIAAPTLVVHGADDVVVPAADARRLAEEIPGARLRLWRGAGHFYVTDEPRADRDVARFLVAHSAEHGRLRRLLARARRQM